MTSLMFLSVTDPVFLTRSLKVTVCAGLLVLVLFVSQGPGGLLASKYSTWSKTKARTEIGELVRSVVRSFTGNSLPASSRCGNRSCGSILPGGMPACNSERPPVPAVSSMAYMQPCACDSMHQRPVTTPAPPTSPGSLINSQGTYQALHQSAYA
jgi:hypothetical protein